MFTATKGTPKIVKQSAATALVDGGNLLGPVVGNYYMDLAIKRAKETGIGWVSVNDSNHFGMAGWYDLRAVKAGFIGMTFTNTGAGMAPTRAKQNVLGTNPICVAAPGLHGDSFVLDMAATTVAYGKLLFLAQYVDGETEVLVPGDPERKHMEKCDRQGGILYHPSQIMTSNEIASRLPVELLTLS